MTTLGMDDEGKLRALVDSLGYDLDPSMLTLDAHIATKIAALIDRHATEKGKKDAREIVALIDSGGDGGKVIEVIVAASGGRKEDIVGYIRTMFELLPKLASLNQKDRRRYAGLAREWIEEAQIQTT